MFHVKQQRSLRAARSRRPGLVVRRKIVSGASSATPEELARILEFLLRRGRSLHPRACRAARLSRSRCCHVSGSVHQPSSPRGRAPLDRREPGHGTSRAASARGGQAAHRFARAGTGICGGAVGHSCLLRPAGRPRLRQAGREIRTARRTRRSHAAARHPAGRRTASSEDRIPDQRRTSIGSAPSFGTRSPRRRRWRRAGDLGCCDGRNAGRARRPGDAVQPMSDRVGIIRGRASAAEACSAGCDRERRRTTSDGGGCTMFHVKHRSADGVLVPRETRATAPVELLPREVAGRPLGPANAVHPHAAPRRGGRRQPRGTGRATPFHVEHRRSSTSLCGNAVRDSCGERGFAVRVCPRGGAEHEGEPDSKRRRTESPRTPPAPGKVLFHVEPRRTERWHSGRGRTGRSPVHFDAVKCVRAGAESARGRRASTHGVRQARFHVKQWQPHR
jgi:hypothetical protein